MRRFAVPHTMGTLALILSLASCGGSGDQGNSSALASLDTRLTNGAAQGSVAGNANEAVSDTAKAVLAAHDAIIAADESTQGHAGEARRAGSRAGDTVQAHGTAVGAKVGGCMGGDLRYGDQWASALPDGLSLYPGARLVEAAGTDSGRCALRVVSFTTTDSPQTVASHYATSVRAVGFDAERQPCRTQIRLGGVRARDDAAYMLFARRTSQGLTEVEIIASADPAA